MPYTPHHQDIGVTLDIYEKSDFKTKAVTQAYSNIIDELSYRGWFEQSLESMPLEVRNFFYILFADNEINNGGFAQYFFNGYGKYSSETVKAFNVIDAPQKGKVLEFVMKSFPEGKYPLTIEEYDELLEHNEKALEFLNYDLASAYYESGENIEELIIAYVKKHFDKFAP